MNWNINKTLKSKKSLNILLPDPKFISFSELLLFLILYLFGCCAVLWLLIRNSKLYICDIPLIIVLIIRYFLASVYSLLAYSARNFLKGKWSDIYNWVQTRWISLKLNQTLVSARFLPFIFYMKLLYLL